MLDSLVDETFQMALEKGSSKVDKGSDDQCSFNWKSIFCVRQEHIWWTVFALEKLKKRTWVPEEERFSPFGGEAAVLQEQKEITG